MNRAAFFDALRKPKSPVFGGPLLPGQVNIMEAILDQTEELPIPHVAYILATAYHEPGPGSRMMPNRENLTYTSAARIAKVWPSRFTPSTALAYVRKPKSLANKVYNGRLGNRPGSDDGWDYRGGGLDHLTGRDNYARLSPIVGRDLVANPEAILEPEIAVKSLVHGMTTGRYTGRCLADYGPADTIYNYTGARAIVNGDVKANGAMIARYARAFEAALLAAGAKEPRQMASKPPAPSHPPAKPVEAISRPAPAPVRPVEPDLKAAFRRETIWEILKSLVLGRKGVRK